MRFFRFCTNCGEKFEPEGKFEKLCKNCRSIIKNVNFIKMIAFRTNIKLNKIRRMF